MDLVKIHKLLNEISKITNDDYYISFHSDKSSVIKIIGLDNYYIHSYSIEELEKNLIKLKNRVKLNKVNLI